VGGGLDGLGEVEHPGRVVLELDLLQPRIHECWLLISACVVPDGFQLVVYCASNSVLRCTNAVAPGATRLTAPPRASKAMPPAAPRPPRTCRNASTPRSSELMPLPLSGRVKKSDLVSCGTRTSLPPGAYQGRWQAWKPMLEQPAS
jgi:hypothetical protein